MDENSLASLSGMETVISKSEEVFLLFLARGGWGSTWSKCHDCGGGFYAGLSNKFREDIIDAQGHARVFPLSQPKQWQTIRKELIENPQIDSVSSYIQSPVLLQMRNDQSIPFAMGLNPAEMPQVLPLDEFLQRDTPP